MMFDNWIANREELNLKERLEFYRNVYLINIDLLKQTE